MDSERIFHIAAVGLGIFSYVHLGCVGDFMDEVAKGYDQFLVTKVKNPSDIDADNCNWCENPLLLG